MILRIEEHQTPSGARRVRGREDSARLIPESDAERAKLADLERAGRLTRFRSRGDWERNLRDVEYTGMAVTQAVGTVLRTERFVSCGGFTHRQ